LILNITQIRTVKARKLVNWAKSVIGYQINHPDCKYLYAMHTHTHREDNRLFR